MESRSPCIFIRWSGKRGYERCCYWVRVSFELYLRTWLKDVRYQSERVRVVCEISKEVDISSAHGRIHQEIQGKDGRIQVFTGYGVTAWKLSY